MRMRSPDPPPTRGTKSGIECFLKWAHRGRVSEGSCHNKLFKSREIFKPVAFPRNEYAASLMLSQAIASQMMAGKCRRTPTSLAAPVVSPRARLRAAKGRESGAEVAALRRMGVPTDRQRTLPNVPPAPLPRSSIFIRRIN
jgi:hypothetical protein